MKSPSWKFFSRFGLQREATPDDTRSPVQPQVNDTLAIATNDKYDRR